jgi:hypothetical protein
MLAERKLNQNLLEETDRLEKGPRDETWVFQYDSGKTLESLVNKPKLSKLRKPKWKVKAVFIFLFYIKVIIDYAPIVTPPRCTSFSNYLFLHNTLHVSDGLSIHHQEFKTVHTATGICQTDTLTCMLASR